MTNIEVLEGAGWVPGIAPPTDPSPPTPRVHPSPPTSPAVYSRTAVRGASARCNMVVGLRSVRQLTLDDQISDIRGMTEGYNLAKIGRIINH